MNVYRACVFSVLPCILAFVVTSISSYFMILLNRCERVRQLDEGIGDIQAQIADAQAEILRGIEDAVLRKEVSLQSAAGALAEVDALLALALSARDLILVRPRVVPESVIYIKGEKCQMLFAFTWNSIFVKMGVCAYCLHINVFVPTSLCSMILILQPGG